MTTASEGAVDVMVVKYDTTGTAKWAQTANSGTDNSEFYSVAVDGSGNVYAAGFQIKNRTFSYGSGVSAIGSYASRSNAVLVKNVP